MTPDNPNIWEWRAVCYSGLVKTATSGEYEQREYYNNAIGAWNESIRLDPEDSGDYYELGSICQSLDEDEVSIANFNKAIQLDADCVHAYVARSVPYFDVGQYAKADAGSAKACSPDSQYC